MKVNFEKVVIPCVVNDITLWHLKHGFLWDVVEAPTDRRLGVFFCTLLCGDGCVIHFNSVPGEDISAATTLYAFRKAIRMMKEYGNVMYATIPAEKRTLVRIICALGFFPVKDGGFLREGREIVLLKYLPVKKEYIKEQAPE